MYFSFLFKKSKVQNQTKKKNDEFNENKTLIAKTLSK